MMSERWRASLVVAQSLMRRNRSTAGARLAFPPLIGNCEGLGDVVVMAMNARANSANFGGAKEICTDLFLFLGAMNQAKVDLKLMPGAFPQPPAFVMKATHLAKVFLPSNLDAAVGPHTSRGQAWLLELKRLHKLGTVSLYGPSVTA